MKTRLYAALAVKGLKARFFNGCRLDERLYSKVCYYPDKKKGSIRDRPSQNQAEMGNGKSMCFF